MLVHVFLWHIDPFYVILSAQFGQQNKRISISRELDTYSFVLQIEVLHEVYSGQSS